MNQTPVKIIIFSLWAALFALMLHLDEEGNIAGCLVASFFVALSLTLPAVLIVAPVYRLLRWIADGAGRKPRPRRPAPPRRGPADRPAPNR